MRRSISTCITLVLLVIFASCSKKQYQHLFEEKSALNDTLKQQNVTVPGLYRIKPQDLLEIKNVQNSKSIVDLNPSVGSVSVQSSASVTTQGESYLVEDDGTVGLTGLGRVQVAGLTRVEAQKKIETLYQEKFLKDPIIELKITNLAVTLFGEVKSPGNYSLVKDKTTLVQLLGVAGGLTPNANEKNIEIIRGDEKKPVVIKVDLSNIQSINDPKTILQSGDIVYVEENKRAVRNDNFLNLSQLIQPALLLFNTALIILTFTRR